MKFMTRSLLLLVAFVATGFAQDQKAATPAASSTAALSAEVQVCTGITDRMPTGNAANFDTAVGMLYCWSKITGGTGADSVKHIWMHDGKEMLTVDLAVKSASWRTYSQKRILPQWTGNWEVRVVDAGGATLKSATFTIGASPK